MRYSLPALFVMTMLLSFVGSACNTANSQARNATPSVSQTLAPSQKTGAVTQPQQQAPLPGAENIRRISIEDARKLFDDGQAVIVDVRGDDAFNAGHIQGARSIALTGIARQTVDLPRDKLIILYCSCPAEHSSVAAALVLNYSGIQKTAALVGGYPAWKKAGYPVEEASSK